MARDAISVASIDVDVWYRRFAWHLCLLFLLVAEILFLTISFDTKALALAPSAWVRVLGWTPQLLRFAITLTAVAMLVSGRDVCLAIRDSDPRTDRFRRHYLVAHLGMLALFGCVTSVVMGSDFPLRSHEQIWAMTWACTGGMTLVTWGLAVLPVQTWSAVVRRGRDGFCWGLGIAVTAWVGGFLTEELWKPLARYTFMVASGILRWLYADTVSDPTTLLLGTSTFRVDITAACSGQEGIGLIVAFLTVYLWVSRKQLRFPHALIMLPIGAAAIWILNALRIAALIVIGASGWPEVALGGFHSQAGWLSFNAVALALIAISIRGRYFLKKVPVGASVLDASDPTMAYLAPFLAIVATSMLTGLFSSGFDWLYPARVITAAAALWMCREHYKDVTWRLSGTAVAIGAIAFVVWLALLPTGVSQDGWPGGALSNAPPGEAAWWVVFRVVGAVVTVPLAEELAFRGFLPRRFLRADFYNVPIATFSWLPFLLSSLLFGALHGQFWLAGTIAGALFGVALYRGKGLGDAVQAHATTNALMVLYVFTTGHWSAWS